MKVLLFVLFNGVLAAQAQVAYNNLYSSSQFATTVLDDNLPFAKRILFQRNTGMVLGLQRGKYANIELGGEAHWRKISLTNPHIIGATANLEYNFEKNVLGYKAGAWMKRGRVNLTYGANISYYTNFNDGHRFGVGPSIGFRLLGFHLINGYNFLTKDKASISELPTEVNTLYMSLRYYFPVQNKFTWDRKTRKRISDRKKARAERKKERQKKREKGEGGILNIFKKKDN